MRPEYEYGDKVRVIRNIRDDGTYVGKKMGDFLVRRGSIGFVKDMGTFLQDQLIYSVHFLEEDMLVGCRQEELIPADAPWQVSKFEFKEKVKTTIPLGIQGKVLVSLHSEGQVIKVIREEGQEVTYHVYFAEADKVLQVPETALEALDAADKD